MKSADGELDGTESDRVYLAPSLDIDISDRTSLTLLASYLKDDGIPTNPFMPMEGTLVHSDKGSLDPSLNLGEPDHDLYERTQIMIGYALEHELDSTWTLASKFNYGYNELLLHSTYIWPSDYGTGMYNRGIVYEDGVNQSYTFDNHAIGTWYGDNADHQLLVGAEFQHHNVDSYEQEPATDAIDPWNPGNAGFTPVDTANNIKRDIDKTQMSLYAQYQMNFQDTWLATVGGRYDWFDIKNTGVGKGTNSAVNENESLKDGEFTLNAGLLYKTDFGLSPYVATLKVLKH